MGEFVNHEVSDNGVATIRLDRPKVNALNEQVATEIGEAVDALAVDENARAVVVWGGERVFAAGADIKEMASQDTTTMYRYIGRFQNVFTRLEQLPQVTIAAITGYALGGGCELALACDLRICAEDSQLGQPEILLGVMPGAGGTQRLPRLVGVGRAKELIYSGRFVAADEALAIGLVNEVVSPDGVYERALELAGRFAAGPTVALMAAKQAIQQGLDVDVGTGLALERQGFAALFSTEDQRIGMESFAEKGPGKAKFTGR
ncbi:MAG: enoyl-CoA hydratase/isomerase family protein [Actinobacteria bacterium]|nr:enoyl-CoA hydratase/isomerase family protein [Actinomycetota bacterium]